MPRPGEPSVEVGTTYLNRLRFEAACWRAVQDQVNHSVYDYSADRAEESALQEACREYDAALVGAVLAAAAVDRADRFTLVWCLRVAISSRFESLSTRKLDPADAAVVREVLALSDPAPA
jgi:hypothetical protein